MKPHHPLHHPDSRRLPDDTPLRPADPASPNSPLGGLLFSLSIFASAFLLFSVQPLIAKYILPWFGGSAGVWTTCMLFFQVLLLGGYAYAHCSTTFLPPRAQAILHILLLLTAILLLPIAPAKPTSLTNPTWQILTLLASTLGLAYFALSSTAPLLQSWFSQLNPTHSPYRLYALSNAASLLALLSYPFVVEPTLSRITQARIWSWGFVGFALAFAACSLLLIRHKPHASLSTHTPLPPHPTPRPSRVALWILLPACATAILLGATNKLCQDVAVVPFLWILPLALYLLSFIIPFHDLRYYSRSLWLLILFLSTSVILWLGIRDTGSIALKVALYSATLLACCMLCHGELARLKPHPTHLTAYYLCISLGGALGGLAVALLAPLVLNGFYELYIAALLCCALLVAVLLLDPARQHHTRKPRLQLYALIPLAVVLSLLLYADATNAPPTATILARHRSFYSALTICELYADEPLAHVRLLRHGVITHGSQFLHPTLRQRPTTYYGPASGFARLLRTLPSDQPRRFGIIGLGIGTMAVHGRPGDLLHFYELDPNVLRFAQTHFSFLNDSPATIEHTLGDARLSLEQQSPQRFDALILDAFSSDSIPVHLLTREAFDVYLRHLAPTGVVLAHISNRYLDLEPLLSRLADYAHMHAASLRSIDANLQDEEYASHWILLTRDKSLFQAPEIQPLAKPLHHDNHLRLWTDDYTSLLPLLR